MGKRMRTFVAVRCGDELCHRLRRESDRLAALDPALRAPSTDDYHVTVQFLGDTEEADVARIGEALGDVARGTEPFAVRYGPLGAFPSPRRPRTVWAAAVELERPGAFAALARAVGDALAPLGYPPERRPYHAHVTLGRVRGRPGEALGSALEAGATRDLGVEEVSDLRLILSQPGSRGYSYIDLTKVELLGVSPPREGK